MHSKEDILVDICCGAFVGCTHYRGGLIFKNVTITFQRKKEITVICLTRNLFYNGYFSEKRKARWPANVTSGGCTDTAIMLPSCWEHVYDALNAV